MIYTKYISYTSSALLLALLPIAVAHGGESMGVDMTKRHGVNTTQPPKDEHYSDTYFSHTQHNGLIYTHIALMILSWVFLLPVAVMFSLANSRFTLPAQFVFLAFNILGVIFSVSYNAQTPDLYPNNAHHKIGSIVTWVVCAQILLSGIRYIVGAPTSNGKKLDNERLAFLPVSTHEVNPSWRNDYRNDGPYRGTGEAGLGIESNSSSLHSGSASTLNGMESSFELARKEYDEDDENFEELPLSFPLFRGAFAQHASKLATSRIWKYMDTIRKLADRVILPFGFLTIVTGVVTFGRFFEGQEIFNGLAHWVKGGVFFWLGIFTLGRWTGSFSELGWAWNVRPKKSQKWCPSAEFVESFLIFLYGATNIFMEHLGGWGGAWTAQDMEHLSITVLFLGGGICGMLIESTRVRNLLNTTVQDVKPKHPYTVEEANTAEVPDTYELSLNPIPALVIMVLGLMMSSHKQHNMMSSMVHKQWGDLLLGASCARGLTYLLMFLRPPRSIFPSRPPTELLAAFGLISGGIIFMASSTDTVNGMIHYDLDAMFMYTVTMGLVALLMAWVIIVLAIKGWVVRFERGRISS
ncbi:hypothetical protein KAF25_010180 [Fusarium avenaceum]|uniref:Integral membrane protein n=1 Tax=Fusarium avenaceum TaxID=40199 RepID=A0A9P7GTH2_9HYPO|nr:hypothetical protein KAF25_010180 [Fusarium avenaceum]